MNDSFSEWLKEIKEDIKIPSVERNQKVHDNYALVLQHIQTCGFYTNTALLNWARDGVADIPDVAKHFHVQCISLFDFMRAMNFRM